MFRARPMAAVAQISVAYETLRNPDKRRAYDASLAVKSEAEPLSPPVRPMGQGQARSFGPPPAGAVTGSTVHALKRPPPPATKPQASNEALPEGRLGSFIAESLREPAHSEEAPSDPKPEFRPQAIPGVETHLADQLASRQSTAYARDHSAAWKRPALAAGALLLVVGLAGALLGWRDAGSPQQAEPDMSIALPAATPAQDIAALAAPPPAAAPAQIASVPETRPGQPAADTRAQSIPATPQVAMPEEHEAAADQLAEAQPTQQAAEQPVTDAPVTASAATLPLSNAVIARTIGRVGFGCGQVASTEAVEGEAGVFKVTCTSGQSYRAAPVRGRYHFRRWGRQ